MNKDSNLIFEAYSKTLREANLKAMSPEEREAYEAKLDKEEAYDASVHGHNKESCSCNDEEAESGTAVLYGLGPIDYGHYENPSEIRDFWEGKSAKQILRDTTESNVIEDPSDYQLERTVDGVQVWGADEFVVYIGRDKNKILAVAMKDYEAGGMSEDAENKKPDISKPLNTRSAIRFINNKATEMFKKIDPHGQIVLGDDLKPFWYDNGVLKALVIVVTHPKGATGPQRSGVQPKKYIKIAITGKPSTGGSPIARIINTCVGEYLNGARSENAEERALDAIGDKRVTKEQARQIADKYTNWSHEELIKMSSAYNNGFNHELQGIADYNDYKDGTLNYYLYEFGQYEALTSH